MANKTIEQLGASGALAGTTLFETQVPGVTPTEKSTLTQLITLLNGSYLLLSGGTLTGALLFTDNTLDIGANGATRPRRGYFGAEVVSPLFTGALTGAASLNVLKAGDTMTGLLTITQGTANTSVFASTGYSLTGANAQNLFSLAGTWNTSGNPTGIRLSITNTASGGTARLMNLLAGAAGADSMFSVETGGTINAAGGANVTGTVNGGAFQMPGTWTVNSANMRTSSNIYWGWSDQLDNSGASDTTLLRGGAAGTLILGNAGASTDFNRLMFGGTTSSFPSIKRSTTILQARLADDSAYAPFEANTLRTATPYTVATLPVAGTAGRRAYVTNALGPAWGVAAAGGGAATVPVFDDGTAWICG